MTSLKNIWQLFASLFLLLLITTGCDETLKFNIDDTTPPQIIDFSPKTGEIGSVITITGEYLGSIDTVRIGGGLALLKSKISSKTIRATLLTTSRSGAITLYGPLGESTSSEEFTINYSVPSITSVPAGGVLNTVLTIEGEHLDAVLNVYFGTEKGTITGQKANKLQVVIPYVEDPNVSLSFGYFDGEAEVKTAGRPFLVDKKEPKFASNPIDLPIRTGETFEIRGTNLDQIEKVDIGGKSADIVAVDDTKIVIKPSTDYAKPQLVDIRLHYHKTKAIGLKNVPLIIGTIYYKENLVLYGPESDFANFYSATQDKFYNPCQVKASPELRDNIHLCLTTGASGLQIPDMNQKSIAYARFKCDGNALEQGGLITRFKKLSESNANEKVFIDKVKEKTLTKISVKEIEDAGINIRSGLKTVIRHKGETNQANIDYNLTNAEGIHIGGVNIFVIYNSANEPISVGFVELVSVERSKGDDAKGSMTINFYLEKQ